MRRNMLKHEKERSLLEGVAQLAERHSVHQKVASSIGSPGT